MSFPDGNGLIPESFDEHTIILLVRPADTPDIGEESLDRLQVEHLTYLRDLQRGGEGSRWWSAAGTATFGRG